MRTNIELNTALLNQVCKLGHFPTKKAAVNAALAEYVKFLKRQELLELQGKVSWEGDLEELRAMRQHAPISEKSTTKGKS